MDLVMRLLVPAALATSVTLLIRRRAQARLQQAARVPRPRWHSGLRQQLAATPVHKRYEVMAVNNMEQWQEFLRRDGGAKCVRCWRVKRVCICPRLRPVRLRGFHLVVAMHMRELAQARVTSTGNLLHHCVEGSELLMEGYPAHEERLNELYASGRCAVLFPAPDSITSAQLLAMNAQAAGTTAASAADAADEPRVIDTLIVLDGTWGQASSMQRRVPAHVPRIRLEMRPVARRLRKSTNQEGRVSTLQAAAALLAELQQPPEVAAALEGAMHAAVEAQESTMPHTAKDARYQYGCTHSVLPTTGGRAKKLAERRVRRDREQQKLQRQQAATAAGAAAAAAAAAGEAAHSAEAAAAAPGGSDGSCSDAGDGSSSGSQ